MACPCCWVAFTPSGALIHYSTNGWTALDTEPGSRMAIGWRLLIPISGSLPPDETSPRRRFNYAYSENQPKLPTVTTSAYDEHDPKKLTFTYSEVLTEHAGSLDIGLRLEVELRARSTLWSALRP